MIYTKLINQIFKEYRDKIQKRFVRGGVKKPWMRYRELDIIKNILLKTKPMKCLEWGLGYSSKYFSSLLPKQATWLSIEHSKEWFNHMRTLSNNNQLIEFIPSDLKYDSKDGDGSYSQFKSYIEFPKGEFNFILIDGRARSACLKKAFELVSENGVVILHDANRKIYVDEFGQLFNHQIILNDYRYKKEPMDCEGGIWIGSKSLNLDQLLDKESEQKIWKFYSDFGKFLRL